MDDTERKRSGAGYRVMLAVTLLAALVILASTLIFSHTAKQASDEVTTALGAFYLEEITDRTVFEISTQLESHILRLERTAAELNAERLASEESLREYLALVQRLHPLFCETLPITLEELFISEMEVAGYDINKVI